MTTNLKPVQRLLLAGGISAIVAAAPVLVAAGGPTNYSVTSMGPCFNGEEVDVFTGSCVPHLAPRSPYASIPGNPQVPSVRGRPCTTIPECQALERQQGGPLPPRPVPHVKEGHDPTGVSQHP